MSDAIMGTFVSRKEAISLGLTRYGTNAPCKYGHIAERMVSNMRCVECMRLADVDYYARNADKAKARSAKWRANNPEKIRSQKLAYRSNPENRALEKATNAAWARANMDRCRVKCHDRRARQMATGGSLSKDLANRLLVLQRGKCACCKKKLQKYHMDHVAPLAKGGANHDHNIQLLCPKCNVTKGAKDPINFMQQSGYLL